MHNQREAETLLSEATSEATLNELVDSPPAQAGAMVGDSRHRHRLATGALAVGLLACLLLGAALSRADAGAPRVRSTSAQQGSGLTGLSEDDWADDWDAEGDDDWGGDDGDWDDADAEEPAPAPASKPKVKPAKKPSKSPKMKVEKHSNTAGDDGGWDDDEVDTKPKQGNGAKKDTKDDLWEDDGDEDEEASEEEEEDDDEDGAASEEDEAGEEDDGASEEDDDEDLAEELVDSDCTDSGHDCSKTKCCSQPGEQCYTKNATWAVCRAGCNKGRHVTEEDGKTWACEVIGKRSPGKAPKCSAFGENCIKSHCCRDIGLQCYHKSAGYATCKPSCNKALDPSDKDSKPWTCKELGTRREGRAAWTVDQCTEDWADCRQSKCCKHTGSTCFERDNEWAACQAECTDKSWTCARLGPPMPPATEDALRRIVPKIKAAPWVSSKCSAFGANCMDTKCCQDSGAKCFRKNSKYGSCKGTCIKGPDPADDDGDDWSCGSVGPRTPGKPVAHVLQGGSKSVWVDDECADTGEDCSSSKCCKEEGFQCLKGGGKATCRMGCAGCKALGARTPKPWSDLTTLFCFAVVTSDTYEVDIMKEQLKRRAGIFACEEHAMMSEDKLWTLDDELGGELVPFIGAKVGVSRDGTAGNAELFMNVWAAVTRLDKWQATDWTIKTDPDAVILPDRLRPALTKVRDDTHLGDDLFAYVKTCHKDNGMKNMMFGAVEALTRVAVEKYIEGIVNCKQMEWQNWGEDLFMMKCLDNLGAIGMDQFEILSDQLCMGVDCGNPTKAVFHPMKNVSSWTECFEKAIR